MTLTQAAVLTKKTMVFGVVFIILGISAWLGYRYYYYNIYLPNLPVIEEQPTNRFGVLEAPLFPLTLVSSSNFSYSVDTTTGELPTEFPKLMKVYFATSLSITLLGPDRATLLANSFGFVSGPELITQTQYQYQDDRGNIFIIDLNSGNFNFRKVLPEKQQLKDSTFLSASSLETTFKTELSKRGLLQVGLESGRTKVNFETGNIKDSQTTQVTIWPDNIEEYPIATGNIDRGLIYATINKDSLDPDKFLIFNYTFWPIDQTYFGTYKIKSVIEAFDDLKNGQGIILQEPPTSKVSLRNVYLAYFQSEEYAPYIQPIYVFEGEGFMAYVPAITDEFLAK